MDRQGTTLQALANLIRQKQPQHVDREWLDAVAAYLDEEPAPSVTVLEVAAPASSVEIESRQKGAPGIKVKVYHADPTVARDTAVALYNETVRMYDKQGDGNG